MTPTPTARLEELIALGEKATAGPWFSNDTDEFCAHEGPYSCICETTDGFVWADDVYGPDLDDRDFIAAARCAPDIARELLETRRAIKALLDDVRRRYPGEALRCPYMLALDALLPEDQ